MLEKNVRSSSDFNLGIPRLKKKIKNNSGIRVTIMSTDLAQLEKAVSKICSTLDGSLIAYAGPVPMPTHRKRWTVRTSPHVNKDAVQVFEMLMYRRFIRLPKSKESLTALSGIEEISQAVRVEIKGLEGVQ